MLEDMGLSPTEIKVFVSILELGESKAGKIIEKTKLQSSSAYNSINSLIERGLVSYIKRSHIKFYKAADPEAILEYIESKKIEFLKILPELKARQSQRQIESVEFFKSYKGIKTILTELLINTKKGDIYRTFSLEDTDQFQKSKEQVYRAVKQIAKEKKIVMRGIFHIKTLKKPTKTSIMKKRYVNFPMPPNTIIINDKVAIISWEEEPSGVLIHSRDIAERYREFFDHLWRIARKK